MSLRRQTRNRNTYPCALFLRLASQICSSLQRTSSQTHLYILPAEFAIYTPFLASLFIRRPSQSNPYCRSVCLIRNLYAIPRKPIFRHPSQSNPYLPFRLPNSKYLRSYSRHLCANSSNILSPVLSSACPPMTQVCTWEHHAHVGRIPWIKTNFHLTKARLTM